MEWSEARRIIRKSIANGTEINTVRSNLREVLRGNHRCTKYDYAGQEGYLVRISQHGAYNLEIPWSMLEACFESSKARGVYNGHVFRSIYPKQAKDHGCHVHVVGMIFKKAGIVRSDSGEKNYYLN